MVLLAGAQRYLREGRGQEDGEAPLLLLSDDLSALGGNAAFYHLAKALQSTSRFTAVLLRALGSPIGPAAFEHTLTVTPEHFSRLEEAHTRVRQTAPAPRLLLLGSLSTLLLQYTATEVLAFLQALRQDRDTHAVLAWVHQDLVEPHVLQALLAGAGCAVALEPPPQVPGAARAQLAPQLPHGLLATSTKRKSGRVQVTREGFQLLSNGSLRACEAPPAAALAALSLGGEGSKRGAAVEHLPSGAAQLGMRHTLTPEEREARGRVVSPWEASHEGRASQEEAPAAGGAALGQVLYGRESESECDSDEDPDDDLDF